MAPPAHPLPPSPPPPEVGDALGDAPPGGPPRKRAGDALSDALPALLPWLSPTDATSTASTCRTTRAALRAPDPAAAPGGRFAAARELARRGWRTPALEASPLWGAGWPARTAAARDVLACAAPRGDLATGTEPSLGSTLNMFRPGTIDAVGCELRLPGGKVIELGVLQDYYGEKDKILGPTEPVLTDTRLYVRASPDTAAMLAHGRAEKTLHCSSGPVTIKRETWILEQSLELVRRQLAEAGLSSVKALDACLLVSTLFLAHDAVAPGEGATNAKSVADLWVREARVRLDASLPGGYTPLYKTRGAEEEEEHQQPWPLTIEARRLWEENEQVAEHIFGGFNAGDYDDYSDDGDPYGLRSHIDYDYYSDLSDD